MNSVTRLEKAAWIWKDQSKEVNQYAQFLQDFRVENPSATLYIAADMNYAAFINGQYVPSFAYSDYPACRSVDTLDISPYLHVGENRLCVIGYCQITDGLTYREGDPGVRFAVYTGDVPVALSGSSTLARLAPDYESGPIENITSQLSYSFHYDAKNNDGWLEADYTPDNSWHPAVPALTTATLQERPIRPLVLEERCPVGILSHGTFTDCPAMASEPAATKMQYASLAFKGRASKRAGALHKPAIGQASCQHFPSDDGVCLANSEDDGLYVMLDLGKETAGLLDLDIELEQAATVFIGFGEHLDDLRVRTNTGGRQFGVVYHAKAGRQSFTHYFKRLGARYLQLHIYAPSVKLYYAGLRPVTYPLDYISDFDCGDLLMNKIYTTAMDTLRLCIHEHYEDCPWREQGLYAMDSRIQMLCGYYAFKETAMPRESLRLLAMGQWENGLLEMCAPSSFTMTIPSFSLAFVNCVKDYLDHTGDTAFVQEMLPVTANILRAFLPQLAEDGLLADFVGEEYWNFYEWTDGLDGWVYVDGRAHEPSPAGFYAPMQAMYLMAADAYLAMCDKCGAAPFEPALPEILSRLRQAAQKFWDSDRQVFVTYLNGEAPLNEVVQAQFICAGIATSEQTDILLEKMTDPAAHSLLDITQSHCIYKYEALLSRPELYGAFVRQNIADIWGGMLFKGATSFWETQRGAWDFTDAGSLCHGWATIPIYIFHRYGDYVL